jgi:hypothetical protein
MLKSLITKKNKKKQSLVITFHTNYDTMNLDTHFKKAGIKGRLIPVPRTLSSSCGMAWEGEPEDEAKIRAQIEKDELVIDQINLL